jgi:hypothetical protein
MLDINNWVNPSTVHSVTTNTTLFYAPQAGKYLVSLSASLQAFIGSSGGFVTLVCNLMLNGSLSSTWNQQQYYNVTNLYVNFTFTPSVVLSLASGTSVGMQVNAQFPTGGSCVVLSGASAPFISMIYLGP